VNSPKLPIPFPRKYITDMKLATLSKVFFIAILTLSNAIFSQDLTNNSAKKILAGYYPDWGVWNSPSYTVDLIPYKSLTHVIWSFISPNADGSLRGNAVDDPSSLDQMVKLAHDNGVMAIVSLGGAGLCENFASVSSNDELRSKFVSELIAFVNAHALDGVDMDWEYSGTNIPSADTIAYNKLLRDIRTALPNDKSLSAALPCSDYYGKYFTAEVLLENLDWFGIMTYDITGDWDDKARFDSPLYPNSAKKWTTWSWQQAAAYWKKRGVSAEKLVFGVPSFGFVFSGTEGPGSTFDQGSTDYKSYAKIMTMYNWEFFYDDVSKEPYGIFEDKFVTFENANSVTEKSKWIVDNNYAGAMVWELSQDYIETVSQPIIQALSTVLLEGVIPEYIQMKRPGKRMQKTWGSPYIYDALGQVSKQSNTVLFRK